MATSSKNVDFLKNTHTEIRKPLWNHNSNPQNLLTVMQEKNIIQYKALLRLKAQLVKNLPAMWETRVQFLGWEDALEKGTTTHSSILAWRIPWTVQSIGPQRVRHDWLTFTKAKTLDKTSWETKWSATVILKTIILFICKI